MAAHSSILGGRIPGQKNLEGYSLWGCKELDMTDLEYILQLEKKNLSYVMSAKQGDVIESQTFYISEGKAIIHLNT